VFAIVAVFEAIEPLTTFRFVSDAVKFSLIISPIFA